MDERQMERILWKDSKKVLFWIGIGILIGSITGLAGTIFLFCVQYVTSLRQSHLWLVFLLPLGGLVIAWMYHPYEKNEVKGTDLVIDAIRSDRQVPGAMVPLIFFSTVITHLFGGSAGREGAALQLGGSIGFRLGKWLHLNGKDIHIAVLCGMAGCFSALFGTPVTAVVFVLEVVTVGVMYYSALVPCTASTLTAFMIAQALHAPATAFTIAAIPAAGIRTLAECAVLAALCGLLSILFCKSTRTAGRLMTRWFPNSYLRAAVGGAAVIVLYLIFGSDYLGAGGNIIAAAISGNAVWYAFLLKLLFTAVTLGSGFKGGEIVPAFFVGATFGCFMGSMLGIGPTLGAAIGFVCLFCGITNCPISSFILGIEVFGGQGILYFMCAVAISYTMSGYFSIYTKQKILYSKTSPVYLGGQKGSS
jgi:H+/Cl- antiporter ClcA